MKTLILPVIEKKKNKMYSNPESISMQILSNCEDIDLIDDLLPADENLEQFFINL